jgi:hypothetical protein
LLSLITDIAHVKGDSCNGYRLFFSMIDDQALLPVIGPIHQRETDSLLLVMSIRFWAKS